MYWDSKIAGTFPLPVAINLPPSPRGEPEILALNNNGRVALSYYSSDGATQTLGIFHPVPPEPIPTPTPVPPPAPAPEPPVVPTPVPTPAPTPVPVVLTPLQQQIVNLEERLIDVRRRVRNPVARANQLRSLNLTLSRLRQQAAREEQAGTTPSPDVVLSPLEQQILTLENRLIDVRRRVRNPAARAEQLRRLNLTLRQLRQQQAASE